MPLLSPTPNGPCLSPSCLPSPPSVAFVATRCARSSRDPQRDPQRDLLPTPQRRRAALSAPGVAAMAASGLLPETLATRWDMGADASDPEGMAAGNGCREWLRQRLGRDHEPRAGSSASQSVK